MEPSILTLLQSPIQSLLSGASFLGDRKEALAGSVSPSLPVRPPAVRSSLGPPQPHSPSSKDLRQAVLTALRPHPGQFLTMPGDASTRSRCLDVLGLGRVWAEGASLWQRTEFSNTTPAYSSHLPASPSSHPPSASYQSLLGFCVFVCFIFTVCFQCARCCVTF